MIFLLRVALSVSSALLLARSQSSTFQISLTCVFPSCFRSSSLPFPWYFRPQHFPHYVFFISLRIVTCPVIFFWKAVALSLSLVCARSWSCDSVHPPVTLASSSSRLPQLRFPWRYSQTSVRYSTADLITGTIVKCKPPPSVSLSGILLSHITQLQFFQVLQSGPTHSAISPFPYHLPHL